MTDKRYTVRELNMLRGVCERKYLYGTYDVPMHGGVSRGYMEAEKVRAVEEMVRTHMIAGHTAEDLLDSERPADLPGGGR